MPKPNPALYSVEKTFIWFALAGITLTVSLVLMVAQDYSREWKGWQRKFLQLKYEKTKTELQAVQEKVDRKKLEELEKEKRKAHQAFKAQRPPYRALEKEVQALEIELTKAGSRYQDIKQYQDSYKYFLEEYRRRSDPRANAYEEKLKVLAPELERAKLEVESLEKEKEEKQARKEAFKAEEKRLEKEIERWTSELDRTQRKLTQAKPGLIKELLNTPMLDFLRPTLAIQQVVLEDLYDDYHFTKVQKVDRCTSCHLGIDQKGFEDSPQPFKTHPKLELFVGSDSPHALEKFGCTVCHSGNGHSLSFKDAAHTPQNEEQAKAWEKKYHWHPLEKWAAKMLPLDHAEASCAKCHKGVVDIPQAEKLNEGRRLARTFGCFGCHKIEGFSTGGARLPSPQSLASPPGSLAEAVGQGPASGGGNLWKAGPGLEHIGSKVEKDWLVRWLQNPKSFRPATKMPRVFHLTNTSSPEEKEKSNAAIEGITAYLLKHSTPVELKKPAEKGEAAQGEKLFKELGCAGCHKAGDYGINTFAANLTGIGSKTTPEWLFTWLKNPKHYLEKGRMPNLRLTDEEASHLTSYLLTLRNEAFEKEPIPQAKPEVLDEMVLGFMRTQMRKEEALAELSRMDSEAKRVYLGEKMIAHQGCFACHDITGFKEAKPIGTELSNEGAKEVERLDFGFVPIERTRQAWFFQKLKEPRIFDQGKIKDYLEKLKMPQFDFTDAEAHALTTFLLSLVEEPIPLAMERRLDLEEQKIESGRLLTTKLNCQGCHVLEGKGGQVKELLPEAGLAPPPLEGEGAKVQEEWLYQFLKEPSTIRPWLKFRMPTFGFHHEELMTLIKYFSHLAHQEIFFEKARTGQEAKPSRETVEAGRRLFETFQCAKCHEPKKMTALGASFLAPDLTLAKERLKSQWIVDWLKDPQVLQPGTMMPSFFPEGQSPSPDILGGDSSKQIEAIRDYLLHYTAEETKISQP